MDYFNPHYSCKQSGFTLTEMLAVASIVSIIMAVAIPSLLGVLRKYQVNSALQTVYGAIKETQRQAIRQKSLCRINIDPNSNQITGNPTNCLLSDRLIDDNIIIRTNLSGTPPNISFSHKGSTTKSGTIVVSSPAVNVQKCFVISLGLGIMRTGKYTGSSNGSVSASHCQSN